jgi:hypothetical protein
VTAWQGIKMELSQTGSRSLTPAGPSRYTVLGLFDDMIDAEQALAALRREERPAEQVSLLVRDRAADAPGYGDRHGEVARAVVASALSAVSGWLLGLAALIVPEQGTLLVAGPIGAALAGVRTIEDHRAHRAEEPGDERGADTGRLTSGGLRFTLTEFGFRPEEAAYVESRLAAGSVFVAVTTPDPDQLQATRRFFADHSAVHIGQAQTGEVIVHEAEELLAAAPEEADGGEVVVADAVAPLRRLCGRSTGDDLALLACGARVVDAYDEETGEIEDLLADGAPAANATVRYAVVGFGGLIGLGRHRIAVPAEQVDLGAVPVRIGVSREVLRRAPAYEHDVPFSRREEMAVNAYFGTTPYWLK